MDFLLVLIELFSLRVTAEALRAKIDRKSAICKRVGHHSPNFRIEGDVSHQSFSRGLSAIAEHLVLLSRPMFLYTDI